MKTSDDYLQEGIAAYKRGQKQAAGRFIKQAIKLNPKSEGAWLWLSGMVKTDEQRRHCLMRVLALNPNNKFARRGLEKLTADPVKEKRPLLPVQQPPPPATPVPDPVPLTQTHLPIPEAAVEISQPGPEPIIEPDISQPNEAKSPGRLFRAVVIGLILLMIIGFGAAVLFFDIPLPPIINMAFSSGQELPLTPEEERAVINTIYENIAATNAENVDRYMATIHTQSRGFDLTRKKIEILYRDYDLVATISSIEIVQYSQTEARVNFILETRKQVGPDFRDNRINGAFILRPENGQWKLYDQIVSKIQYFEYVE